MISHFILPLWQALLNPLCLDWHSSLPFCTLYPTCPRSSAGDGSSAFLTGAPWSGFSLLYCILYSLLPTPHCGITPLWKHSTIHIGSFLLGLVLFYCIPHSVPPIVAFLCHDGCSSIPVGAPQPWLSARPYRSALIQPLLFTLLSHHALPISYTSLPGGCSPFSSTYCLSNPDLDLQLANIWFHLC